MEETKKRKTVTSSAVKNRYNKKVYGSVAALLPKELVAEFKQKCLADGVSQSQIIRKAIENYLGKEN